MQCAGRWFPLTFETWCDCRGSLYLLIESCDADWRATNAEVADILRKLEVQTVDVQEIDKPALFLEINAGWTQNTSYVDPLLFENCCQCRGDLASLKSSVSRTALEAFKICCELLSTNIELGARDWQAESCKRHAPAALKAADTRLAKMSIDADDVTVLQKWQAVCDISVEERPAELTEV